MSEPLTVLTGPEGCPTRILRIPYSPISLNKLVRHWAIRDRQKNYWVELLTAACGSARVKNGLRSGKRLVHVEIDIFHSRLFDKTNLEGSIKPIEDAIVSLGWAHDDRPEFMERKVTQFKSKRKEQHTIVRISRGGFLQEVVQA